MRSWVRSATAALVLLIGATACDDSTVDTPIDPNGDVAVVSVHLTDAPGDVAAVWVDVLEIYLQGGPAGGGRVVLLDEPTGLIELTSLAGTTHTLLQNEEIEAGSYGQLRFVIGGAVLETVDGAVHAKDGAEHPEGLETTGDLHCPSCSQTGIKVVLRGEDLALEGDEDLLLDFDVSQSFGRQAGASGMWVMHPVIHGVRMIEMGRITGTVALAVDEEDEPIVTIPSCPDGTTRGLEDFVPVATAATLTDDEGAAVVRTGATSASGDFGILALVPDGYDLGYMDEIQLEGARLIWTAEVDPTGVTVTEGGEASGVVYTITGASCEIDEEGDDEG